MGDQAVDKLEALQTENNKLRQGYDKIFGEKMALSVKLDKMEAEAKSIYDKVDGLMKDAEWARWQRTLSPEAKMEEIMNEETVERGIEILRQMKQQLHARLSKEIEEQAAIQLAHQKKMSELHDRSNLLGQLMNHL